MSVLPVNLARVSNLLRTSVASQNIASTQRQLLEVQNELSTGKSINTPSDDPGRSAIIQQLQKTLESRQAYGDNLKHAGDHLGEVDSTLGDINDLIKQAQREAEQRAEQERQVEQKQRQEQEQKRVQEEQQLRERQEAERKRAADVQRQQQAEAERQRVAEIERKQQEEAQKRKAAEDARLQSARENDLQKQLADEEGRSQAENAGLLNQYIAQIQQRVVRNWNRPPSARTGLECQVKVTQTPSGVVLTVQVTTCNGDAAVQQSIEAAVLRSSPLPPPPDPRLFERNLVFVFKPAD